MLGGRGSGPLHVWGPSGPTPDTGTAAFVGGLNRMLAWDRLARERVKGAPPGDEASDGGSGGAAAAAASSGAERAAEEENIAVAHEFDYAVPNQVVYESNGVKITASPVKHYFTGGPVGYRLEWGGLAVVFGGDSAPAPGLAELAAGADVVVLDAMATPPGLAGDGGAPVAEGGSGGGGHGGGGDGRPGGSCSGDGAAGGGGAGAARVGTTARERANIAAGHATPAEAGQMFAVAAPRLGEQLQARACMHWAARLAV
jgi:hypothetical protein